MEELDKAHAKPTLGRNRWEKIGLWSFVVGLFVLFVVGIIYASASVASDEGGYRISRRDKPFGVYFIDERSGWIVGNSGLALETTDGGASWQRVTIPEDGSEGVFRDVLFRGEKGWIVGSAGLIMHTDDGGRKWYKQPSNVGESLMRIFFLDIDKGFAVGANGVILRTEDGGSSWETVPTDWMMLLPAMEDLMITWGCTSMNFYDVFFLNDLVGWIVGDWGVVLCTLDGGNEWRVSRLGGYPTLFSVHFRNEKEGWAVGQRGCFLKTGDGGRSWEEVTVAETADSLFEIDMVDNYGVVVGDNGMLLKTEDGGGTWVRDIPNLPLPLPWLVDVGLLLSNRSVKAVIVGKGLVLTKNIQQ